MRPSHFAIQHAYLFTALLIGATVVIYLAAGTAAALLKLPPDNTGIVFLIANLALAVLGAALLTGLGWWKGVGFRALVTPRDIRLYWIPATLVVVNLAFGVAGVRVGRVVYLFVLAGLIGSVEEVYFRGLILRAIAPRGPWKAVLISSLVFGLLHSLNVLGGSDPIATLLQVGYALAIGFGFAAVSLRTGVIWPLVIIHALIDFASFIATKGAGASKVTTSVWSSRPSPSLPSLATASS